MVAYWKHQDFLGLQVWIVFPASLSPSWLGVVGGMIQVIYVSAAFIGGMPFGGVFWQVGIYDC